MLSLMPCTDLGSVRVCACEIANLQLKSRGFGSTVWLIHSWTKNWLQLGYFRANSKACQFQSSLTINYAHKIGEHFAKAGLGLPHLSAGLQGGYEAEYNTAPRSPRCLGFAALPTSFNYYLKQC